MGTLKLPVNPNAAIDLLLHTLYVLWRYYYSWYYIQDNVAEYMHKLFENPETGTKTSKPETIGSKLAVVT